MTSIISINNCLQICSAKVASALKSTESKSKCYQENNENINTFHVSISIKLSI